MATTLGIVEVPDSSLSDRPFGFSIANRHIGGKSLLEWVVRRVTDSLLLDQVVVLFDPSQAESLRSLTPPDISAFVSPLSDPLSRFAAACREFGATDVVRVSVNCPFIDPALIDRLVCTANAHPGYDYIGYCVSDGKPTVQSKLGLFAEWCHTDAVYRADRSASSISERDDVTRFFFAHPHLFQLRLIPVPRQLDRPDVRLTVSGEEDLENAHLILDALGPDQLDWQTIAGLLNEQPGLRQRMADLNTAEQEVPH